MSTGREQAHAAHVARVWLAANLLINGSPLMFVGESLTNFAHFVKGYLRKCERFLDNGRPPGLFSGANKAKTTPDSDSLLC
jgi:hypothetical protein